MKWHDLLGPEIRHPDHPQRRSQLRRWRQDEFDIRPTLSAIPAPLRIRVAGAWSSRTRPGFELAAVLESACCRG